MTERQDNPLAVHVRECADCRDQAMPVEALSAVLDSGALAIDTGALSQHALARLAPELQRRADALFWRRLLRALAVALVPLPLVVIADLRLLAWLYDAAATWLPSGLVAYLVLSYAASLVVLIGSTYAAIPLLLARPVAAAEAAPA